MTGDRRDEPAHEGARDRGRPGAALGAAIRRARRGRYTLAQLSDRSGVSTGLLSLIERGKGNPSINTLAAIADALELSLPDLVAEAIGDGGGTRLVAELAEAGPGGSLGPGPGPTAPEFPEDAGDLTVGTSVVLRRGQEARIAVLGGSLELTLRDRTSPLRAARGQSLSVDLSLRPAASPLQIPPAGDHRWRDLVRGEIPFEPTTLAGRMLYTHVVRCVRQDESSPNVERWIRELRGFFVKYEAVSGAELSQLFGREAAG